MFPSTNDINLSPVDTLENNVVENQHSNILDEISIVPGSIDSIQQYNILDEISIELDPPNSIEPISNDIDQPMSTISVPFEPSDACFPTTFSDINFNGVLIPPDFESLHLDMNQIFTATASAAAVGVLATVCSNSNEPSPKEKNSKETTQFFNSVR